MKKQVIVAFVLTSALVFAQHGKGGGSGMGQGSGGGMGHKPMSSPKMSSNSGHGGTKSTTSSGKSDLTIAQKLDSKPKLSAKLQSLLPAGTDLKTASDGFRNFGQFVAAVHVSHNLGIPFDQLKAKMTGDNAESLGKAIKELKPDADAKAEVKKAQQQSKQDQQG
jgi:hypothetical protein